MLYDHHGCSESAVVSQPIFMALNHVKLDKQSTRKYLYSLVWQWAHAHERGSLPGMGEEIGTWVSEAGGSCKAEGWVIPELIQPGIRAGPWARQTAGTSKSHHNTAFEATENCARRSVCIRKVMLDVGRVCCRTQNDGKRFQQGSRK